MQKVAHLYSGHMTVVGSLIIIVGLLLVLAEGCVLVIYQLLNRTEVACLSLDRHPLDCN